MYWDVGKGKWVARIYKEYAKDWLGSFTSEEEAARAYDKACLKLYGTTKNFPIEEYLE